MRPSAPARTAARRGRAARADCRPCTRRRRRRSRDRRRRRSHSRRTAAADSGSSPASCRRGTPASARATPSSSREAKMSATASAESRRATRPEHLERLVVEMVRVVDDADRRDVVAGAGEDRQHPEPDERALRRSSGREARRLRAAPRCCAGGMSSTYCASGRPSRCIAPNASAASTSYPETRSTRTSLSASERGLDEGRLADARVAVDEERAARAVASTHDQRAESFKLIRAPQYSIECGYGPQTSGYVAVGIRPSFRAVSESRHCCSPRGQGHSIHSSKPMPPLRGGSAITGGGVCRRRTARRAGPTVRPA